MDTDGKDEDEEAVDGIHYVVAADKVALVHPVLHDCYNEDEEDNLGEEGPHQGGVDLDNN